MSPQAKPARNWTPSHSSRSVWPSSLIMRKILPVMQARCGFKCYWPYVHSTSLSSPMRKILPVMQARCGFKCYWPYVHSTSLSSPMYSLVNNTIYHPTLQQNLFAFQSLFDIKISLLVYFTYHRTCPSG